MDYPIIVWTIADAMEFVHHDAEVLLIVFSSTRCCVFSEHIVVKEHVNHVIQAHKGQAAMRKMAATYCECLILLLYKRLVLSVIE